MRVVRRARAAVAEPRDEESGGGGPHASHPLLPRYPVSRLVGHEDGAPIQLVRFTGEFRGSASAM